MNPVSLFLSSTLDWLKCQHAGRLGRTFARSCGVLIALSLTSPNVHAQDATPEQLQVQYDEALKQLQAAQDRKNELANENEQLKRQIETLTQIVHDTREQTLFLQTHFNLWRLYVTAFPEVGRWFEMSVKTPDVAGSNFARPFEFMDLNWQFSAVEAPATVDAE